MAAYAEFRVHLSDKDRGNAREEPSFGDDLFKELQGNHISIHTPQKTNTLLLYSSHCMRFKRSMAAISYNQRPNLQATTDHSHQNGVFVEEIEGFIRVYKNGHIERPSLIPSVPCTTSTARDVVIDKYSNLWARVYVPSHLAANNLPVLVYFHGGGFCVGSAAWSCYHDFLTNLACKASCVIVSVNYRLAPESRLPSAYDDGVNAVMWVKQQAQSCNINNEQKWWPSRCNFSNFYLSGDSAGANIAYNVTTRLSNQNHSLHPLCLKGNILIQPFFGGEAHTWSEKYTSQPLHSALTLSNSDAYWRMSLPLGATRDHPWCNPLANGVAKLRDVRLPPMMVCISEMDILKDRNLEMCNALTSMGKRVESMMYKGVGHAFQVLNNSQLSRPRTQELVSHIKAFINQ